MADSSLQIPVIFAGGGTGGHLYPAIAIANALTEARPDVQPWFLGARRGIEARVLPARGLPHTLLPIRGIHRGKGVLANVGVIPALIRSLCGALDLFAELRPRLVVLTGGYASAPAGLVAVLSGTPLAIQEQNAHPGLVTRMLSRFARQVHVAFPEALDKLPAGARPKSSVSGNPIAPPVQVDAAAARETFGLHAELPVVLIVGGSQGSAALNAAVVSMISSLNEASGYQLLWGTGLRHEEAMTEAWRAAGSPEWVHLRGFIDDMPSALALAALAVSRAGAMATSEFLSWGLPAILVPLPTAAADHQTQNARALADAGCAEFVAEPDLTGVRLAGAIAGLMADPGRLASYRAAALNRARPQAAHHVARALAELLPSVPHINGRAA